MKAQLCRTMFAAAIFLAASGARAAESATSIGHDDAARMASAVAPTGDVAPGDRSAPATLGERTAQEPALHLDCPCNDPNARSETGVRSGFTDPAAASVWSGP